MQRKPEVMNNASEINRRSNEVSPLSVFGASAMTFPDKISSVRANMATRHTSQRVVLINPEFAHMYTGAENNFGDRSSWNVIAKDDYELMRTFRKFKDTPYSPICYIFRNLRTGKYECQVYKPAVNLTEKYGFRMHNRITNYNEGDIIRKDTPITQSSSYDGNSNYCAGRNIRMANAVLPELAEDALLISDHISEELAYDMVDIVTVILGKDAFLLNKYGNESLYKPFPDIGEQIQNNVLCAIRENSYLSSVSEALIPHINDTTYVSHGTVVDLDIFSNIDVENEQYNYYASQIHDWYTDIYSYISTIMADDYQDDVKLLDIYHEAEKYLNKSTWVTKENIVDTILRFTVLQPTPVRVGQKVVGRYGNKSVVTKVVKRELMPKTDDGRPIDMLSNALAIPNRIIGFATYESKATFQMERMHQHILQMREEGSSDQQIMDLVVEFVSIFNPDEGSDIARLYRENPNQVIDDILTNGIYIQIAPLNEVCMRDALLKVDEMYPDILKPYKLYTKLRHRWIESDKEYEIGYQYMWVLKQEPSKAMSVISTGRTTLYDIPVKTRQYNKNLRQYSDSPIKFGEYDTYNFLAGVGVKMFAKITTYYRGSQYEENSMLMAQLNNMGIDVDRYNKFPQIDNLKNILKFLGVKLKPDLFGYNTIGNVGEKMDILFNNVTVNISIPDLRYILIMHAYYLQYDEYMKSMFNMDDFLKQMGDTNVFIEMTDEYVQHIFDLFLELLPTLQQLKQYH